MKPFLANKSHSAEEVEKMHQAWFKSVVMQVTFWCQPYAKDDRF
jgi:thiaminase